MPAGALPRKRKRGGKIMAQTDGQWEITLKVTPSKRVNVRPEKWEPLPPFDEKYTIEKPTLKDAIAEAIYQAGKKQRPPVSRPKYEYKSAKTLREPSGSQPAPSNNPGTDVRGIAENIFTVVSANSEFASLIAEFKNLEQMVAKLGGVGKVFNGVSIANDSIKLLEAIFKYSNTTDPNKQKEAKWEIVSAVAGITRTTITIAFPPTAIIDAMVSVAAIGIEAGNKELERNLRERTSDAAVKALRELRAKYDKEPDHLPIMNTAYPYEVGLYCLGFRMMYIKMQRDFYTNPKNLFVKNNPYKGGTFNFKPPA